jgi:chromate reductase
MADAPVRIAAICGSLRQGSFNRLALELAISALPAGTLVDRLEFRELPHYDGDLQAHGMPLSVINLADRLRQADGVVIVTPEYNFSIPGALKNALDWVSRVENQPFKGKSVALLSASGGPLGGARVQYDLRRVMHFLDAMVLLKPEVFIGSAQTKFAKDECTDDATRKFVQAQMTAFVAWIASVKRAQG